ncbi:TraB/GumN family protein [Idiomarina sp.]|uniref:TraB/GumN family protein n=1 Tax=Idiomarina sp. TaxID=1874361 RepID=UPI003A8E6998
MLKLKTILISFVLCLLSTSAQAEILYKLTKEDQTIWVYGTLHAAKKDAIILSETARNALKNSETVWFEVHPEKLGSAQSLFMQHARRSEGKLSDSVDSETWQQLTTQVEKYGMNASALEQLNAWFAQIVIVSQAIAQSGYTAEGGSEGKLFELARNSDIPVKGLETVERQIDALRAAQSESGEGELLEQTLAEVEKIEEVFADIQKTWLEGDLDKLTHYLNQNLPAKALDELITKRNNEWITKLAKVNESDTVFVAVGAGHLGGQQGVLEQFEKQGADIEKM